MDSHLEAQFEESISQLSSQNAEQAAWISPEEWDIDDPEYDEEEYCGDCGQWEENCECGS